jgi:hypothetical protein
MRETIQLTGICMFVIIIINNNNNCYYYRGQQ